MFPIRMVSVRLVRPEYDSVSESVGGWLRAPGAGSTARSRCCRSSKPPQARQAAQIFFAVVMREFFPLFCQSQAASRLRGRSLHGGERGDLLDDVHLLVVRKFWIDGQTQYFASDTFGLWQAADVVTQ